MARQMSRSHAPNAAPVYIACAGVWQRQCHLPGFRGLNGPATREPLGPAFRLALNAPSRRHSPVIHRTFTDRTGCAWTVSESPPRLLTLIADRERRSEPRSRRRHAGGTPFATRDLGLPSLLFESSHERRQLTPIPPQWGAMPDDQLEHLLGESILTLDA